MAEPHASGAAAARTCLIVEDDPVLRRILRGHLSRAGFVVVTCERVSEAREALERQVFSHVITDAILPDGVAADVLAQVRARESVPLVVVMSGDESVGHTVRALSDPRTRFLLKPFSMSSLEGLLEHSVAPAP